jgi:hypothetical protein
MYIFIYIYVYLYTYMYIYICIYIYIGLVEAVGRPIVLLYPLFLTTQEVLKIATEYDVKKSVSVESILQMGKMIVMLIAVVQLAGILTMYSGLGYVCLALGI